MNKTTISKKRIICICFALLLSIFAITSTTASAKTITGNGGTIVMDYIRGSNTVRISINPVGTSNWSFSGEAILKTGSGKYKTSHAIIVNGKKGKKKVVNWDLPKLKKGSRYKVYFSGNGKIGKKTIVAIASECVLPFKY